MFSLKKQIFSLFENCSLNLLKSKIYILFSFQRNKRLYVRLLDFEMSPSSTPPDTTAVMKVLQSALNSNLSIEDKTGQCRSAS